jgi:hypothetical protein
MGMLSEVTNRLPNRPIQLTDHITLTPVDGFCINLKLLIKFPFHKVFKHFLFR